jgi:hypothetical protein
MVSMPILVMRGLDPRIHPFRKKMDRRVKPGDDDRAISTQAKRAVLSRIWGIFHFCQIEGVVPNPGLIAI